MAICQLAGIIGSIFTSRTVTTWYADLQKPFFNPPGWIFAPVWTLLFVLMGISLYLVWNSKTKKERKISLWIFSIQLLLNIIWSLLFFGLQNPLLSLIEIIILWTAILLTIMWFYKISKTASWLLVPYLLWVSFAIVLNFFIWWMN